MGHDSEDKWEEIRTGVNLETKSPVELLDMFRQVISDKATVLREKFIWKEGGEVTEKPMVTQTDFRARPLGEDVLRLDWKGEDMDDKHLYFREPESAAIQIHKDGRKSVVISHKSKSLGGQVVRRFTALPNAPSV